ncbi:hypothetical protein HMPREF0322_00783 [Desulfitobacterium hafniense DP7]|uniref:Uncharacterized protein n=2 Tax=Desulfitobacterium hafniense TaxID=49338 RepID=G9XIK7_DESHA|nr:hypothetical protein HMPREF0322_00783 [Desulfitobacterium hafniense DP7]
MNYCRIFFLYLLAKEGWEMKFLGIGIIVSLATLIISWLVGNPETTVNALLIIGLIPMAISALFAGVFISGDRMRGNYSGKDDFRERMGISTKLFLLGLPSLLTAFAVYFIMT